MNAHPVPEHDAIVLAGGRGTRLGGVDKAGLMIAGRPLLGHALAAAAAAQTVVVVGPVEAPQGVLQTVEDPPDGGPVAGIAAGLAQLTAPAPWVLVLAVDQPGARPAALALLEAAVSAPEAVDALCHIDGAGRAQWLLSAYRSRALQRALAEMGETHDAPVRRLARLLRYAHVSDGQEHVGDVDTWDDVQEWERRLGK